MESMSKYVKTKFLPFMDCRKHRRGFRGCVVDIWRFDKAKIWQTRKTQQMAQINIVTMPTKMLKHTMKLFLNMWVIFAVNKRKYVTAMTYQHHQFIKAFISRLKLHYHNIRYNISFHMFLLIIIFHFNKRKIRYISIRWLFHALFPNISG